MAITTAGTDLELQRADGSWLGLMLSQARGTDGKPIGGAPKSITEILESSDDDLPTSKKLATDTVEDFSGGVGISYNAAPGVYTRTPGYAMPAGFSTDVTLPATQNSNPGIPAMTVYNGDLFVAQAGDGGGNHGRVMRSIGQTAALTDSLNLGADDIIFDLMTFTDTSNSTNYLYAASNRLGAGRLHRWDGTTWTSTAIAAFGGTSFRKLGKAFWVDQEGIGSWRMLTIDGAVAVSYTKPGGNPMLVPSWVLVVIIQGGVSTIAASRRHAFFPGIDGVYDLDGFGDSPNIAPYFASVQSLNNGAASIYFDGSLYVSMGNGMVKIPVDQGGMMQENVGHCAPGWGTAAESPYTSATAVTALAVDQGYVVAALWNAVTGTASIFWGQDRNIANIQTPNPLVWHGPECVSTVSGPVTKMLISTPGGVNTTPRLWIASSPVAATPPLLSWVSLPIAGGPIGDLVSGAGHRFATGGGSARWNPISRLELLSTGFGERASKKALHGHTVITRGLSVAGGPSSTARIDLESRVDSGPTATTYTQTDSITASPQQDVTPSSVLAGWLIRRRFTFTSPDGAAAVAANVRVGVLDACRSTAWKTVPSYGIRRFRVSYGDGVISMGNTNDARDPDTVTADLAAITNMDRTVIRDRNDKKWTVRIFQTLDREVLLHESGPFGKTVTAQIELAVINQIA